MNQLMDIITKLNLAGKTASEVVASLAENITTHSDSSPKNYADMVREHGLEAAEGILKALKNGGLEGAAAVYTGAGIDLSLDVTQNRLHVLAMRVPQLAEVCKQLKFAGRVTMQQWEASGLTSLPTEVAVIANAHLSENGWRNTRPNNQ